MYFLIANVIKLLPQSSKLNSCPFCFWRIWYLSVSNKMGKKKRKKKKKWNWIEKYEKWWLVTWKCLGFFVGPRAAQNWTPILTKFTIYANHRKEKFVRTQRLKKKKKIKIKKSKTEVAVTLLFFSYHLSFMFRISWLNFNGLRFQ